MSYNIKKLSESSLYKFFNLSTINEGVKRTVESAASETQTSVTRDEFISTIFSALNVDSSRLEELIQRNKSNKMQDINAMSDKLNSFTDQVVWQIPEELNEKIETFEESIENSDEFDITTVSESIKPAIKQIEKLYKESAKIKQAIKRRENIHNKIISKLDETISLQIEDKDQLKEELNKYLNDIDKKKSLHGTTLYLNQKVIKESEQQEKSLASVIKLINGIIKITGKLIERSQEEYFNLSSSLREELLEANKTKLTREQQHEISRVRGLIENEARSIKYYKERLKLYRIELVSYTNIEKMYKKLSELLKVKKHIAEQKEKIEILFDKKEEGFTENARKEEIKRLVNNIDNEALITQLNEKFEESKADIEDFQEYHVSEILQSCLINAVNSIEINKKLANIKKGKDSIKIITNTNSAKTSNSITANDDKFGLVSSEFKKNSNKVFNINDIVYGDSKKVDHLIASEEKYSKKIL
jgi:hypothetical protein